MRKENPKDGYYLFGNYLGDFSSEPKAQVESIVFERQGVLHVYYSFKEGLTWDSRSDDFLNEIGCYASQNGMSPRDIHLHFRNEQLH